MPLDPATHDLLTKAISSAVVPVVIISACGLLSLAFYNRLTAILARLRALALESLHDEASLLHRPQEGSTQRMTRERARRTLEARQQQADMLLHRARMMRRALYSLLSAIALLVLCSLSIGAGVLAPAALYAAVTFFACGLASLLAGVVLAILELRQSIEAATMEHEMVEQMAKELPQGEEEPSTEL